MTDIVSDDEIRSGTPRVEGSRITVLDIKRRVIDGGEDPFAVAAEYDLDVAAVFSALAYYYENGAEMRALETEREELVRDVRQESRALREQFST